MDTRVFCQELYCIRLHLALLQNIEDVQILGKLTQSQGGEKVQLMQKRKALEDFESLMKAHESVHSGIYSVFLETEYGHGRSQYLSLFYKNGAVRNLGVPAL